jgi:hypothetical protein
VAKKKELRKRNLTVGQFLGEMEDKAALHRHDDVRQTLDAFG